MGRLSTSTRDELVAAAGRRYIEVDRHERGRILDELTSLTGLHRKHAARLLRGGRASKRHDARPERRIYDEAIRQALWWYRRHQIGSVESGCDHSFPFWFRRWSVTATFSWPAMCATACCR